MSKVIYSGTFDPITKGHLDIIKRASKIFNYILIAVAESKSKKTMFNLEDRVEMVKLALSKYKNIEVKSFNNLLVDFVKNENVFTIIRGLRGINDFEYELQMNYANKSLNSKLETIYIPTSIKYSFISSSLVRGILNFNEDISFLVPKKVNKFILSKLKVNKG